MIETTRAGSALASLKEAAEKARIDRLEKWKRAIAAAETNAVAGKLPIKLYHANYRIAAQKSEKHGDASERRAALVELIRSLKPNERHQGTSTWIFRLHIADAADISDLLAAPLDRAIDLLAVAEIGSNRAVLGNAKLAS